MKFNAWTVFVDFSIMAALLIVGQVLRSKVKLFQRLLLPAALMGGFIGLALGPNGLKVLPLSSSLGTYASILIVLIFAAMPIGDKPTKQQLSSAAVGGMFTNVTGIALAQYGFGLAFSLYVLNLIWKLHPGFGLMLATGFYGGHGTAAAVGSMYKNLGWNDALGLGMTSATVGIVGGIIGGMAIINWGTRRGYTHYVTSPEDLPQELRTGLVPPEKQKPGGKVTVSSIAIDPLAFHAALILIPSLIGYYLSQLTEAFMPNLTIPAFCLSLIVAFVLQFFLVRSGADRYVDRATVSRLSGTCTDFLIIAGTASIKLSLLVEYAAPLALLFGFGFLLNWVWFLYVGMHSSPKDWFERNMMVWGHATGVVATGILLLRVVDPEFKARGVEDSGIADIFNRPIIIALQVIPPVVLSWGGAWPHITTWVIIAATVLLLIIAKVLGWWHPERKVKPYRQELVSASGR